METTSEAKGAKDIVYVVAQHIHRPIPGTSMAQFCGQLAEAVFYWCLFWLVRRHIYAVEVFMRCSLLNCCGDV